MRRDALLCNAKVLHLLILTVLLCMSCDGQEASSSRGEAPLGQNVFGMPHHKSEQKEQLTRVSGQCFWTAQQHNMAKGQVTSLICCIGHDKSSNLLWAGASGQVQGIKVTCWCSDAGQRLGICTAAHEDQLALQCRTDEEHKFKAASAWMSSIRRGAGQPVGHSVAERFQTWGCGGGGHREAFCAFDTQLAPRSYKM